APIALVAEATPRTPVHRREQGVVIQHLLEVRHEPLLVDRVAMEAAADEVVHTAERHVVERPACHLLLTAAEEELEHRRGRELRRPPPASPVRIEAVAQVSLRLLQE